MTSVRRDSTLPKTSPFTTAKRSAISARRTATLRKTSAISARYGAPRTHIPLSRPYAPGAIGLEQITHSSAHADGKPLGETLGLSCNYPYQNLYIHAVRHADRVHTFSETNHCVDPYGNLSVRRHLARRGV